MELETLLAQLGVTDHMKELSDWRDGLLRANAAALQALTIEKDAEKQAELDALNSAHAAHAAQIAEIKATPPPPVTLEDVKAQLDSLEARLSQLTQPTE